MASDSSAVERDMAQAAMSLLAYCKANDWAGYDPYDALNSRIFSAVPLLNSKIPRLILTQALKRSAVNLRGVMVVPKLQNPKAIGLFLSALLKLSKAGLANESGLVGSMVERLIALRSKDTSYWCWGYSFPWQGRSVVVPAGEPNLVCTTFVASALLDCYEQQGDSRCLDMALSAAEYILNELYWTEGASVAGFCYPLPSTRASVHNANLLAAALFCRVHKHTGEDKFIAPALKAARYSAGKQQRDGSWNYGESPSQRWIDNFHTGYNLCALQQIDDYLDGNEFESCIQRGFDFYRTHFFRSDGAVKYFHDRTYPIDIHCVAQSIITLMELQHLDGGNVPAAHSVFRWAMKHMCDKQGYFYYRVLKFCTIRIPYMRWSQAWMLLALATLVSESNQAQRHSLSASA